MTLIKQMIVLQLATATSLKEQFSCSLRILSKNNLDHIFLLDNTKNMLLETGRVFKSIFWIESSCETSVKKSSSTIKLQFGHCAEIYLVLTFLVLHLVIELTLFFTLKDYATQTLC